MVLHGLGKGAAMSTHWDVYCIDCDDSHGFDDMNHRDNLMQSVARNGPAFKKAAEILLPAFADLDTYARPNVQVEDSGYGKSLSLEWFAKHGDHHLVARNEYGQCLDECGAYFDCKMCDHPHQLRCRRPVKHEGDHAPYRADGLGRQARVTR